MHHEDTSTNEPAKFDANELFDRPAAPDEPPLVLFRAIGNLLQEAIEAHEARWHDRQAPVAHDDSAYSARLYKLIGKGVQAAIHDHEASCHRGQVALATIEDLQAKLGAGS